MRIPRTTFGLFTTHASNRHPEEKPARDSGPLQCHGEPRFVLRPLPISDVGGLAVHGGGYCPACL